MVEWEVCIQTCISMHASEDIDAYMYLLLHSKVVEWNGRYRKDASLYIHIYMYMYIYVCIYIYMYIYTYICKYTYACTYTDVHAYTCTCTSTYTYTYTYTNAYMSVSMLWALRYCHYQKRSDGGNDVAFNSSPELYLCSEIYQCYRY